MSKLQHFKLIITGSIMFDCSPLLPSTSRIPRIRSTGSPVCRWTCSTQTARRNPGRIHYTGAPEAVVRAYAYQFEEDMGLFLKARSEEIVSGGVIVILMPGVPEGVVPHDAGIALTFLGSILMDMVKEGLLNQDQVDTFNFPHVYPTVEQMTSVVQKNGCFQIVKMELRNANLNPKAHKDIESSIVHVRAFTEGTLGNHFGSEIVDQLFIRALNLKTKVAHKIDDILFAILKRN